MIPLLTIPLFFVFSFGKGDSLDRELQAQQLLRATLSARDSLALPEFIKQLEQVTHLDKKNADAFHELGLAYTRLETVWGRERALPALERALRLQPRNVAFHYSLAELHRKSSFGGAAAGEFKKIMRLDPSDPRPYYHLALFQEEDMLHYREMVSLHENATIFFTEFAEEDFREAEELYRTAIALDPTLFAASYRLAGLYYEAQRFQEMAEVLQAAINLYSSRPTAAAQNAYPLLQTTLFDLQLLLGLAHTRLQQPEAAQHAFTNAFAEMPKEDRQLFFSLATVLSPDELPVYLAADEAARQLDEQRYWNARDPLFMTAANERMLEHFSRIAYANLRFGFPEKKIAGWKTDRGQTLIRFGFPKGRVRTRADLGTTPTGHVTLNASKEVWEYGDFRMLYEDRFLNRNYAFAWSLDPNSDGKNIFERQIRSTPERFEFLPGGKRLQLPHVIAQFRAPQSDSTLLEIYYGLDAHELEEVRSTDAQKHFQLERGFFLCDQNWQPLLARRERRDLAFGENGVNKSGVLLERWVVPAPVGEFNLSLETVERNSGRSGVERETITIESFAGEHLQMSSVILAAQVAAAHDDLILYKKGEVNIIPSLQRKFGADSSLYVYYEIYNLARGQNGQTSFRVENTITPIAAPGSDLSIALNAI
ncbi:GWxTD domain-containing protein, partial [candidate division KSB1 bacterium]|nr:GWxTD domain-containing protein [candidate division KSB1 bacterium]